MPPLPWDFAVIGTPVSHQASSSSRTRWKADVAAAAKAAWPAGELPLTGALQIKVTCFHDSAAPLDVDNMLKPIQDALIGIVYVDDKQLTDTHGALRDLNGQYWVRGITLELAKGFASNAPFVHIEVGEAPDQGRLR